MNKDLSSIEDQTQIGTVKSVIGKPLGHIKSTIFWSIQQRKIMDFLGKNTLVNELINFYPLRK